MNGLSAPSGFQAQFQEFMYYAGPIIQILFWVVIAAAAIWACVIFKRYVAFQMGAGSTMSGADEGAAPASEKTVSVEEFVE
ncbi:MAG: hypothetical protein Q8K89_02225 [Actinomycetota bacterium]|nr:hypothetical protein [Actinomycetota bacterium]